MMCKLNFFRSMTLLIHPLCQVLMSSGFGVVRPMKFVFGSMFSFHQSRLFVCRFLDERHPEHYKVFNLCTERKYSLDSFGTRSGLLPRPNATFKYPPNLLIISLFTCKFEGQVLLCSAFENDTDFKIHCKPNAKRRNFII